MKPEPTLYRDTPSHTRRVDARVTEEQLRTLHAIARRHACLCADPLRMMPVPSPRALVQAIADGKLIIVRAAPARPAAKKPKPPASPK